MHSMITKFFLLHIKPYMQPVLLIIIGFFIARILSVSIMKTVAKHATPQQSMLLRRIIFYFVLIIFVATAIQQLGFKIGALLGAAGILTVAIGIASQTSMSNIISGIFMIGEKPFEVGHTIKIGETQGEVLSIDLLSVRIRTSENTMVRIPNETLIKSAITNLSSFPIRRADLKVGLAYKENIEKARDILLEIAKKNPLCLTEPKPQLQIAAFGDSTINLQFSVWSSKANFSDLKNSIQMEIKAAFDKHGIEMGSPSHTFCFNPAEPLAIRLINSKPEANHESIPSPTN